MSASEAKNFPVIVDLPTNSPKMGFEKYVKAIASSLIGGNPAQYTVGLYGAWGSGKTSLLSALKSEVEILTNEKGNSYPNRAILVDFDAWRYGSGGLVTIRMLMRIEQAVRQEAEKKYSKAYENLLMALKRVITSVKISAFGVEVSPEKWWSGETEQEYFMPFDRLSLVGEAIDENSRIVIFVDDLDRCSPHVVVEVLESMRILMDIKGLVFVLALDYEYLVGAIEEKYKKVDAHRFIEKIIQVPFHLPTLQIEGSKIGDIVPNWSEILPTLQEVEEETLLRIMKTALRSNPRQIKRLLNSYLLVHYMQQDAPGFDQKLTLSLLGLQIAWPTEYSLLRFELLDKGPRAIQNDTSSKNDTLTLGSTDFYATHVDDWYIAINSALDGKPASEGDNKPKVFAGTYEERNIGNRLAEYLSVVLGSGVPIGEIQEVMTMTAEIGGVQEPVNVLPDSPANSAADNLAKADEELKQKYDELMTLHSKFPGSDSEMVRSYYRFSRKVDNRTRVFCLMHIRPTQRSIRFEFIFNGVTVQDVESQSFNAELEINPKEGAASIKAYLTIKNLSPGVYVEEVKKILTYAYECLEQRK